MDTKNDIRKLIASRLKLNRAKQTDLAKQLDSTQAKLSMFLSSNEERDTTLRTHELNKLFDILGINTYLYYNRIMFAKELASKLRDKGIKVKQLNKWNKYDLFMSTEDDRVMLFFDVDDEEHFNKIKESNLIDIENTFPYLRSIVQYHLLAGDNPTPSSCSNAILEIGKSISGDNSLNISSVTTSLFGLSAPALLATSLFPIVMPYVAAKTLSFLMKK